MPFRRVYRRAPAAPNFAHVPTMNHRASETSWSKIWRNIDAYDFRYGFCRERVTLFIQAEAISARDVNGVALRCKPQPLD